MKLRPQSTRTFRLLAVVGLFSVISTANGAIRYTVVDLSARIAPHGFVKPADINNADQIVGQLTQAGVTRGFLFDGHQSILLAPLSQSNYNYSSAVAVNNLGQIVGLSDDIGIPKAAYWSSVSSNPVELETGGGPDSNAYATAINDDTTIAGYFTGSGSGNTKSWTAAKWQPDDIDPDRIRVTKLDTPMPPPAGTPSGAFGINAAGQIVGSGAVDSVEPVQGPLRWNANNQVAPLEMFHGIDAHQYKVLAINDAAVAVGSMVYPNGAERAMRWNADGTIVDLGYPVGFSQSAAVDINKAGRIVGRASIGSTSVAAIFLDGAWADLNRLAVGADGWLLQTAVAINDRGTIVGLGTLRGSPRAFLLEPASPTQLGDYNGDGQNDAADYTVWRNWYGSEFNPVVDGNGDHVIDVGDYDVWRRYFGTMLDTGTASAGGLSFSSVPEPANAALGIAVLALLLASRLPVGRRGPVAV